MRRIIGLIEDYTDSNWFCLTVISIFVAVVLVAPILIQGLPSGLDALTDLRFASAYRDAIIHLDFSPSWADDGAGLGSVGIRFYPPLAFYVLALTELIVGNWFYALMLNLFGWMLLGCVGVYILVREWGSPPQAMLAAILYAMVPQHLMEIFQFFLYAEFAAWGLLPFCFLFVARICRAGKWQDVFLFAVAYSALILTHIPTTIIASVCLPVFVLILLKRGQVPRTALLLTASIAATLAATAFRWIVILQELRWLAHNDEKYSVGYYEFSSWLFPTILQERTMFILVVASWICDIIVALTMMLLIVPIAYLIKRRRDETAVRKLILASTLTALFGFFMLSRASEFVWIHVAFLQRIQFPWRFLSVVSMLVIVSFTLALPALIRMNSDRKRLIVYPALAVIVAMMLFNLTQIVIPSAPYSASEFDEIVSELKSEPIWEGWWPVWARRNAFEVTQRVSARSRVVNIETWEPEARIFTIEGGQAESLHVRTFYYPYWKATVNETHVDVAMDQNGAILVPLGKGPSTVKLAFEEPRTNTIALFISVITWILLLSGVAWTLYGQSTKTRLHDGSR